MNQNKGRNELDNSSSTFTKLGLLLVLLIGIFFYLYFTGELDRIVESIETINDKEKDAEFEDEYIKEENEDIDGEGSDLEVPFSIVNEVPTFPGCSGSNVSKKNCFNKKMSKHIRRNFNVELANELGLPSGNRRIYVRFKINKNGRATDIHAKASHPKLKKEAIRIIKKLPIMYPAIHEGKPVSVAYTVPITFAVD